MFDSKTSLDRYFREVSYGQLGVSGDVTEWLVYPKPMEEYCPRVINELGYNCDLGGLMVDAFAKASQVFDLSAYSMKVILINGFGPAGYGSGGVVWANARTIHEDVVAHEIGHAQFSLPHSGGLVDDWLSGGDCTSVPRNLSHLESDGCRVGRYGDGLDPMGAANSYHFHSLNKLRMGFLTADHMVETGPAGGTYDLDPLERPPRRGAILMVKVAGIYPPDPERCFYFIEYRSAVGFDGGPRSPFLSSSGKPVRRGVVVRLAFTPSQTCSGCDALTANALGVGGELTKDSPSFKDPSRGLTITLLGFFQGRARIQVDRASEAGS